jgi:hypothetical protein
MFRLGEAILEATLDVFKSRMDSLRDAQVMEAERVFKDKNFVAIGDESSAADVKAARDGAKELVDFMAGLGCLANTDDRFKKIAAEHQRLADLTCAKSGLTRTGAWVAQNRPNTICKDTVDATAGSLEGLEAMFSETQIAKARTGYKEACAVIAEGGESESSKEVSELRDNFVWQLATKSAILACNAGNISAEAFEDQKLTPRGLLLTSLPIKVQEALWQNTSLLEAAPARPPAAPAAGVG